MPQMIIQKPSPKQDLFLRAAAKNVGFGGARGGGKSWGIRTKAKLLCVRYAGIKCLIVRKTYPELINNHVNPLRSELHGVARYNKQEKCFFFQNGSTIKFGYCANDGDLEQYQGAEYDVIFLDEATNLRQEWIEKITACLRGVNDFPKRIYYTFNPGGVSHGYFKRIFIDRRFEEGENPEDYVFIQSLVTDNHALMASQPDYIRQLEALPPKLREAWLYGRWDIYEGQFFEDFRTEPDGAKCLEAGISIEEAKEQGRWTHVIKPLDLNSGNRRGWQIYRSYDFGYAKPFSCAWWAIDYDGVMYRILELYGCTGTPNEGLKWTPDRQFEEIARVEREHPWLRGKRILGVADPAIWDASRGDSIADTAAKYGIWFEPGDHERIAGWMQCHYRLQFDEQGYARCYIFEGCTGFIRTIPLMMYDDHKVEDLDTSLEDHIADEWRYMCMARPIQPMRPVEAKTILNDPLNQFTKPRGGY